MLEPYPPLPYKVTAPRKRFLRCSEVTWADPNPIGLMSLQEEEETPQGTHTWRKDHVRR